MEITKNEMIAPESFKEVKEYLSEHYEYESMGGFLIKHGTAFRYFESMEGFEASMYVGTFEGERTHSVRAHLSVKTNDKQDFSYDKVNIVRTIFTLDELKEMESKVTELNEFVKRLGLWK